ncbi:hypothetical protein ruthe_01992 [Rubellimicrobium thermophilum DSM 16684]|uniref:DUF2946 domain-containing protein n=1 Tax=Rubellimicrobium thermophilum DSM 16684 TaxID=1123069 RepID=S9QYD8_9RHOB|nr:hypothetical protein [Rubellimicrobium thermophilum]EPX84633.1 hypothetical protein ruthe_01992 [Rubellimicrobium thermophilum DSM 16684]
MARIPSAWLRLVLALALLWAGSIAPGVMPGRGADGSPAFVLCTEDGERLVVLDAAGRPVPAAPDHGPQDRHAPGICAFAALTGPALPAGGAHWTLPAMPPAMTVRAVLPARPAFSDPAGDAHRPRGPPTV